MRRLDVARTIAEAIGHNPIVVCSLGSTSRAWREAGAPNATYYGSDPMGIAASLALGLALAVRPRRVLHLAGDGDLTMNLQVLLAHAGAPPCALAVVVFHNGRYETGGGQPLAGNPSTSLSTVAQGVGLHVVPSPSDLAELADRAPELWGGDHIGFTTVAVEPEASPYGGPGDWSGVEERTLFVERMRREAAAGREGEA